MTILSSLLFLNNDIINEFYRIFNQEIQNSVTNDLLNSIYNRNSYHKKYYGAKLENLNIQTSTYGKNIPIIYGTMAISGNIIWAKKLKQVTREQQTITSNQKHTVTSNFSYDYYATLAIAICQGEVKKLHNIWANDQLLDLKEIKYRFYEGNEIQQADPLITSIEKYSPAYRGLSYIVIEDFALKDYNNKIPNFKFEVSSKTNNQNNLCYKIKEIHVIPGSGEFSYDTQIMKKISQKKLANKYITYGQAKSINQNNDYKKADAMLSLDELQYTLPKVEWISVVVNWYADDLDIKKCNIYPAVEFQHTAKVLPEDWSVAGVTRNNARLISQNINNAGTINDQSLIRYIKELKSRGYKILIYPMINMANNEQSWHGQITGDAENIEYFFKNQYNNFIKHYCHIAKEISVDGFIIGSELIGLTKIKNNANEYPAVNELIKLASYVKDNLHNTIITYAAHWEEYHSSNHEYNMDDLWASPNIDVVGINAYFPLINNQSLKNKFTIEDIMNGWNSGEGYEYFYLNSEKKTEKINYTDNNKQYAWKNLKQWWVNQHINPNGKKSKWQSRMKKIWFTSYGFPSIKDCASQPNILIDYSIKNNISGLRSQDLVDFNAQKIAIEGTIKKWENSDIVEKMFLWGWNIRPYPSFPTLSNVWNDAENWNTSHDIQGKISLLNSEEIVDNILQKAQINSMNYKIDILNTLVKGYAITERQSVKSILENLQNIYFFDIVEQESKLFFITRARDYKYTITVDEIIDNSNNHINITIKSDAESLNYVNLFYLSQRDNYKINLKCAYKHLANNISNRKTIEIPITLHDIQAQNIANTILESNTIERLTFNFTLSVKYLWLNVSDIIRITLHNNQEYIIKITKLNFLNFKINITGILHDNSIY